MKWYCWITKVFFKVKAYFKGSVKNYVHKNLFSGTAALSLKIVVPSHFSMYTTHVWKKHLDQLRSPPTIYTSYPWKKCSNLVQFLKYLVEPFLRALRSKDVRCCILPEFWGYNLKIFQSFLKVWLPTLKR